MGNVTFKKETCKGCSLCVEACPKKIIEISKTEMNDSGYYVANCIDMEKCIACAFCAIMCPDCVITVEKE